MREPKPYWYLNEAEMDFWDADCLFHNKIEVTAYGDSERVFMEMWNNYEPSRLGGEVELEKVKHYCAWCRGITFDDSRGHCCACGGQRSK